MLCVTFMACTFAVCSMFFLMAASASSSVAPGCRFIQIVTGDSRPREMSALSSSLWAFGSDGYQIGAWITSSSASLSGTSSMLMAAQTMQHIR